MWRNGVVKRLDVGKNSISSPVESGELRKMQALAFKAAEEILRNGVIVMVTLTAHALAKTRTEKSGTKTRGGVLDATIGVKDEPGRGSLAADSHAQGVEGDVGIDPWRQNITNDLLRAQILNNRQMQPALTRADIGEVGYPDGIRGSGMEVPVQEVGCDGQFVPGVGGHLKARLSNGADLGLFHQAMDTAPRAGVLALEDMVKAIQP